jgi:deoxyribonuclease V
MIQNKWMRSVEGTTSYNIKEAIELQKQWACLRRRAHLSDAVKYVGGADVAFSPDKRWCIAGVVVLSFPELQIQEFAYADEPVRFPYVPGLLSFREAPAMISAARKLSIRPDVLLIDGQGLAHPRRFGLACHVGVHLNWATIGCAKSRLIGDHRQVGLRKGCRCRLMDGDEVIGSVLRTREKVKCIYVSEGHLVELESAVKLVLRCCNRYRLPEPTRKSHYLVTKLRRIYQMGTKDQNGDLYTTLDGASN